MNLRQAAERTRRSVTTLRRYIRSGRLRAEKEDGRYGPEYFVHERDLDEAGLSVHGPDSATATSPAGRALAPSAPAGPPARERAAPGVPLDLFRELQWKHEQLLVQYGMMRAGGLRAVELREQIADREREISRQQRELDELRAQWSADTARLERELRAARFELEGRELEIEALRQKVRGLELVTRNQVTSESIDEQYARLMRQAGRVKQQSREAPAETDGAPRSPRRSWIVRDASRTDGH